MDRLSRATLRNQGLRLIGLVAAALGLFVAARGVSASDVVATLRAASEQRLLLWVPIILAAGILFRSARFGAVIGDQEAEPRPLRFRDIVTTTLVSQAANNVLPVRAGELVRTRDLIRLGCPLATVALAQLAEKVVEGLSLAVFIAPLALSDGHHRHAIRGLAVTLAWCSLALALAVVLLRATRVRSHIDAFARHVRQAFQRGHFGRAFGWALLVDVIETALIVVCLRAVGIQGGLSLGVAVLAAVNVAILVPAAPGNVGTQEAGASLLLIAAGVPRETALGFAVLYRFVSWVPTTFVGGIVWLARGRVPYAGRA